MAQTMPIERKLLFKAGAIVVIRAQNKSGYEVVAGDTVVLDTADSSATNVTFSTSNTADDVDVMGMAIQTIPNGQYGEIQKEGPTSLLRVDGTSAIAKGDELSVIDGTSFPNYTTGNCNLSSGGTALTGGGSSPTWSTAMVGAKIRFASETTMYLITARGTATALTISPAYRGSTDLTNESYVITYKGRAAEASAGKGGAFATALETYSTSNSLGVIDAYLHLPARIDTTVTGNTLDVAYDEGGSGAGRTITVDSNAVVLAGAEGTQNIFEITNTAGTGALIALTHTTTSSKDIDGTGSSWSVTGAGALTVASLDAGSGAIATTGALTAATLVTSGNLTCNGTISGTIASASWASPTFTGVVTVSGATTFATTVTMNGNLTMGAAETITLTGAADSTVLTVTLGDVVITDGALTISNTNDTTTTVTIDHSGGNIANDSEVLKLDAGGTTAAGGSMLSIEPTGSPAEASFGIHYVGSGKTMQAMNIDCDSATNSCVLINSAGGLNADKALIELTSDGGSIANGGSYLYIHSTQACSATAYGLDIKCNSTNLEAIWVEAGLSQFDEAILLADGAAGTPSLRFTSDPDTGLFWAATYIGFAVAGATEMQIAADLVTLGANVNLLFTTSAKGIMGAGSLELLTFVQTGSAVDEFTMTNAAQNGEPILAVAGDDTDITMRLTAKGDAGFNFVEGTAGDAARPTIHMNSDPDSGIYGTADTLGLSTGGTEAIGISAAQKVTLSGDIAIGGHKDGMVFHVNNFLCPVPATEWAPSATGADIPASQTTKKMWIPLSFLQAGDEIVLYRLVGDCTETGTSTLDCKIVRIGKADPPDETDITGGNIAQVTANGVFDVEKTLTSPEVVATDKQYLFEVLATTDSGDSFRVIGAEVQINRK